MQILLIAGYFDCYHLGFADHTHTLQRSEPPGAGNIQSKVSAAVHDGRSDETDRSQERTR